MLILPGVAQASALSEIEAALPAGKTILTATPQALAAAAGDAILSNTDPGISPANLAAAAFQPMQASVNGKVVVQVRADRNTSAALVAGATINALLSGSDATLAGDVAAITDSLVTVNGTAAAENLSLAGRTAVLKKALGVISDTAVTTGSDSLLLVDQTIGQTLAADSLLESLPANGLITLLQHSLAGIYGVSGKAQPIAPEAAASFVEGLISATVPDGTAFPALAVDLLKNVSQNESVDELVAYQFGFRDNVPSDLIALAGALYKAYPAAASRITQGIAAAVPQFSTSDYSRANFIQSLAAAQTTHAVAIAQGAVFVDPYYSGQFVQGIFTAIVSGSGGGKLLVTDATGLATAVGQALGQDGAELTQVAAVYSQYLDTGALPAKSASVYALALIRAAASGVVAPFGGSGAGAGGGTLEIKAGITAATVSDLASIECLMAEGIITGAGSALGNSQSAVTQAASEIAAMAGGIAALTKNEAFVDTADGGISVPVAVFLASSLSDYIARLGLPVFVTANGETGVAPTTILINAIQKSVKAQINSTVAGEVAGIVKAVIANPDLTQYTAVTGPISVQETAVTNL
ncbi:MAG TPA: hypothetical protein VHY22_00125 [Chthoniobacteraceae bacterium]|nr:hypothetical protein [Chthoniobacteraceae bacterium]